MYKISLALILFTSNLIISMELTPVQFEQLLEAFDKEIYPTDVTSELDLLRDCIIQESFNKQYSKAASKGTICPKCGESFINKVAFRKHKEFCQMSYDEYALYTEKLKEERQPAAFNTDISLANKTSAIAAHIKKVKAIQPKKAHYKPFICTLCNNDECKTLNAFKKHLCFDHSVIDNDISPYQARSIPST